MNAKHTPGPWKVSMNQIKSNYDTVAQVFTHLVQGRNEANARLIASAPDLLEALEDCVAVMDRELAGLKVIQPELSAARAAIAKATGEPQ